MSDDGVCTPSVRLQVQKVSTHLPMSGWLGGLFGEEKKEKPKNETDDENDLDPVPPPPSVRTGDPYMRRADVRRLVMLDANQQLGADVRAEKEDNQRFMKEQRERFRQRGVMLREQRRHTEAAIANSVESCRQHAAGMGDEQRTRQETLRRRRQIQDRAYEKHGRGLTEKYSTRGNQVPRPPFELLHATSEQTLQWCSRSDGP